MFFIAFKNSSIVSFIKFGYLLFRILTRSRRKGSRRESRYSEIKRNHTPQLRPHFEVHSEDSLQLFRNRILITFDVLNRIELKLTLRHIGMHSMVRKFCPNFSRVVFWRRWPYDREVFLFEWSTVSFVDI